MKKLNKKSFYIILSGIIATLIYNLIDLIFNKNENEFDRLREYVDEQRLQEIISALNKVNIIAFIVLSLISAYIIYRLIKNSKHKQSQGYISFLYIINIITAVLNIISLFSFNWLVLINVVLNIAIVIGCKIQKNYSENNELEE